jgi:hypothetical protein
MNSCNYFFSFLRKEHTYLIEPVAVFTTLQANSSVFIECINKDVISIQNDNSQKAYFNKIKTELEYIRQNLDISDETISEYCQKYGIVYKDVIANKTNEYENDLLNLLHVSRYNDDNDFENYSKEERGVIDDFVKYWKLLWIDESLVKLLKYANDIGVELSFDERGTEDGNKGSRRSKKEFYEYLQFGNQVELAQEIKNIFDGRKGKDIALLISELTNRDSKILRLVSRQNAEFYDSIRNYFDFDIGTNTSIDNYLDRPNKYKYSTHTTEIENCKAEIDRIVSSVNKIKKT